MATIQFSNNAITQLETEIAASPSAGNTYNRFSVVSGTGVYFPLTTDSENDDYFYVTLSDKDDNREIVKIEHRQGDDFWIWLDIDTASGDVYARGQEGTTIRAWPVGTQVELRLTAQGIEDIREEAAATAKSLADETYNEVFDTINATERTFSITGDATAGPVLINPTGNLSVPVTVGTATRLRNTTSLTTSGTDVSSGGWYIDGSGGTHGNTFTVNTSSKLRTPRNVKLLNSDSSVASQTTFDGTADVTLTLPPPQQSQINIPVWDAATTYQPGMLVWR